MTFRSFSRFVRWYPAAVAGALILGIGGAFASASPLGLLWAFAGFLFGAQIDTIDSRKLDRRYILHKRAERMREYREAAAKEHLRSLPLRGWTK